MCVTMLVGTTFAWFTDSASTSVNKIEAGRLKVDIVDADNTDTTLKGGENTKTITIDGKSNTTHGNRAIAIKDEYVANAGIPTHP